MYREREQEQQREWSACGASCVICRRLRVIESLSQTSGSFLFLNIAPCYGQKQKKPHTYLIAIIYKIQELTN